MSQDSLAQGLPSPFPLTPPRTFCRDNPRKVTPANRHFISLDILIVANIVVLLITFARVDLYRTTSRL